MEAIQKHTGNQLFPIFLKLHKLHVLIVGGGNVGLEKITFMLKSSPQANVTLVADEISPEIYALALRYETVSLLERKFEVTDLESKDMVIAATNHRATNAEIRVKAKEKGILVNVADTPDLCDFYLGGIVTKGDLKVAISTNGKSPTFAKRFRQFLEQNLPDDIPALLSNLHSLRKTLKNDFSFKVRKLGNLTASLINEPLKENWCACQNKALACGQKRKADS